MEWKQAKKKLLRGSLKVRFYYYWYKLKFWEKQNGA
jgi:hypothetical protein